MEPNQKAIQALAGSARGLLSMSGMKHPDGHYTLGETGHFQGLRKALNDYDRTNTTSTESKATTTAAATN